MDKINVWIYENGFQNSVYNNPKIPVYIRKGNLSKFDYKFKAHWHNDFEIIRVIDSNMKYNIDGQIIELKKDDVLFVNSNRMHFGYSDYKKECNYICLVFDYNLLCLNEYIKSTYVLNVVEDESCPYLIINNNKLNNIIDELYLCHNDLKVQGYILEIFSYIYDAFKKSPKNKSEKKNHSKIREMIEFINTNYQQKLTLCDIAKSGKVSKNTCINHFNEILGLTPVEYLINYRLEKSRELLLNTDLSITQIANEVGFSSSSHYCELFKKLYSLTPSQIRRQHSKINNINNF